jgi:hypothetical protein
MGQPLQESSLIFLPAAVVAAWFGRSRHKKSRMGILAIGTISLFNLTRGRIRPMKLRIALLCLLALCLVAVPATAQTIYNNGPINGTTDAWTINSGFVVSDSFTVGSGGASINGLVFGAWAFPGDTLETVGISITSSEFGGTVYFADQAVNFTQSGCSANQFGFNVCTETSAPFGPVNLSVGTYWLTLSNAVVPDDPIYWDENSGPSSASENSVGTIPSEAFTLLGSSSTSTTSTTGTVPEPSSFMLIGSGILGLAGVLRRKLF